MIGRDEGPYSDCTETTNLQEGKKNVPQTSALPLVRMVILADIALLLSAMKQVVLTRHGKPDVLKVTDAPEPKPAKDEAVVSVKAAGMNFADILAR